MSSIADELATRITAKQEASLTRYRAAVGMVARGGELKTKDLDALAEDMRVSGLTPADFDADVHGVREVEALRARVAALPTADERAERWERHKERVQDLKRVLAETSRELQVAGPSIEAAVMGEAQIEAALADAVRRNTRLFPDGLTPAE